MKKAGSLAVVTCVNDNPPHLPDRETVRAVFAEAARVLKSDGRPPLSRRESASFPAGRARIT